MNIERDLVEDDLPLSLVGRSYLWSSLHWILVKLFTFYRTLSFCSIDGFIGLGNMIFVRCGVSLIARKWFSLELVLFG